jgi:hypothetical protein
MPCAAGRGWFERAGLGGALGFQLLWGLRRDLHLSMGGGDIPVAVVAANSFLPSRLEGELEV